ncbi:hypothetical protein H257_16532 [Aphanomyces astaci]|uniref:Uncharacterized protein n=1 Tax=Aphanomyces astaci TaxID=112090 RepID=W4FKP7_APHAT|nr:hypothetical protein H257_16532 [Aphanomyces astaci]ETV67298.1 hypothetical protein H257_16532 [Aphanomyces astaci]|eukprot:XP_009843286.1 hypothetical protein H257_16532 [Aphanomyces astaci]
MQAVLVAQARAVPILVAFVSGAWVVGVPTAYLVGIHWHVGLLGVWIGMSIGYAVTTAVTLYGAITANWEAEADKAVLRSKAKHEQITETTTLLNDEP